MTAAQLAKLLSLNPSGDTLRRWLKSYQRAKRLARLAGKRFDFETWLRVTP